MSQTRASDTIVEEITIRAPADRVFEALTNPEECTKWWVSEGRFQTTHIDTTESVVRWDLEEHGGITTVRLTYSGLTPEGSRISHRGWPNILAWLKSHVER